MKMFLLTLVAPGILLAASAQESSTPASDKPAPSSAPPAKRKVFTYAAPKSGSVNTRVDGDGASRTGGEKLPNIYVLAPKKLALTTQAQPALFWYQTQQANAGFELTLTEPKKPEPLLSLKGAARQDAGTHSVSLARNKVTLNPNVTYQWSVALVPDPKNRSKDLVATGYVKRVEAPAELTAKLEKATPVDRAALYAEAGYWYDSLQSISTAIADAAKSKDANAVAELKRLRASLLDQGSLKEAAAADRK
jgi:hypothetical protein